MNVILIRHGETKGNKERRYIGRTDEPLSYEGIKKLKMRKYPHVDKVYSSPMLRCLQTANIIYKKKLTIVIDGLRECDFGDFEYKNYDELKDDAMYIRWLESGGKLPFPNGETHEDFIKRCCKCFREIILNEDEEDIAFTIHGGTVMAVTQELLKCSFYDCHIENGDYIVLDIKKSSNGDIDASRVDI